MTKEELAQRLNGREYRNEVTPLDIKQAKDSGLVIVYGASDDLMEFEGAISEEFGTEAYFDKEGNLIESCDDECIHYRNARKMANKIDATYNNGVWNYTTNIPHAKFQVFEEKKLCCNGIVFDMNDLK